MVEGRKTWYEHPHPIQTDVDRLFDYYNHERSYQDYRLKGRTPVQALREALGIENIQAMNREEKILPDAA